MVIQKGKQSLRPTETRRSARRKDIASDTIATSPEISKPPAKSAAIKPPAKAKSAKFQTRPSALRVGDKIPRATLELKVIQDDGARTSLGEQLEISHPGGVLLFVYPKTDDDVMFNAILEPSENIGPACDTDKDVLADQTKVSDFIREFDDIDYDYQTVDVSPIGLTPQSVSANATYKEATNSNNLLLSDAKGELLKALNFGVSKSGKNVGFVHIDKEGNVLAHKSGGADIVLLHLDSAISAFMQGKAGEVDDEDGLT
ncbi:hypothetical protein LTR84_005306 [Exophiala bonariae]|uniref:Uncharacterized protein n=1 Tax=Exophiala bonariae TaxID=1690606 RepID=A0AAV9N6W3_9EURO|nr:hypothetical protein LTR84_005306 [Exophiala bonariae]